jgi:hypothetical protein
MRTKAWLWLLLPLAAAASWAVGAGCENTAGDCVLTAECTGGGNPSSQCDPSATNGLVPDGCGLFLSASADAGGDGTRGKPFRSFADAMAAVKKNGTLRLYVCAESFAEAVEVPAGLTVYGGLDCKQDWKFSADARTVVAPGSGVPLTFDAGKLTHVENVRATAPDGAPPDPASMNPLSGGPSIAAVVQPSAALELARCDFEAGNGADGKEGVVDAPATDGKAGEKGDVACDNGTAGAGAKGMCGATDASGGDGGTGGDAVGAGAGMQGASGDGLGGTQQTQGAPCLAGGNGKDGVSGMPGKGGSKLATLLAPDMKGSPGTDGQSGTPGTGGGGGGGGLQCVNKMSRGPGGGGGGAGGCGGPGGKGGGAGGSSIALWAPEATLSLTDVTLTAKNGGQGAKGGKGQKGGKAGPGGAPGDMDPMETSAACKGGDGGKGGDGASGGGGQGGHSIAVVWKSAPPTALNVTLKIGEAGKGGAGDSGDLTGADGDTCLQYDFSTSDCKMP